MKRRFLALAATPLVIAMTLPPQNESLEATLANYPTWKKANPVRVNISMDIDMRCRSTSPAELKQYAASPHRQKTITVYSNPIAQTAMRKGGRFPNGSIIVKEKQSDRASGREMATVMIKRSKGYNPSGGDWEYAVLNKDGKVSERGILKACMSCHADRAKSDFVFRSYLSP